MSILFSYSFILREVSKEGNCFLLSDVGDGDLLEAVDFLHLLVLVVRKRSRPLFSFHSSLSASAFRAY